MGCDIHAYSEKKDSRYGYYELHGKMEDSRDYEFFGLIAGVRRQTVDSMTPKGIPEDVSSDIKTLFLGWDSDAHTPSYLTLDELYKIKTDDQQTKEYLDSWIKHLEGIEADCDKKRVVFWFDN